MWWDSLRIGHGFDVHITDVGRPLVLGGVEIREGPGLYGHSDADVLTHALIDALLGAAGLPDIGSFFPDTDNRFLGASSVGLLEEVMKKLEGWNVINVDLTMVAERPKLLPYRESICASLACFLNVSSDRVNFKATTHEKLDAFGRGEGMKAYAVVLLARRDVS